MFRKEIITRQIDGKAYLVRWHLLHTRWGRVYLHKIILTDSDCPHDHPWRFISIILKCSYIEHEHRQYDTHEGGVVYAQISRRFRAPAILVRPATWAHTLEIPGKPVWTLVITSTWKRKWGFWTKKGWIRHNDYISTNSCD